MPVRVANLAVAPKIGRPAAVSGLSGIAAAEKAAEETTVTVRGDDLDTVRKRLNALCPQPDRSVPVVEARMVAYGRNRSRLPCNGRRFFETDTEVAIPTAMPH